MFTARLLDGKWQDWRYAGDRLVKEYQAGEMHITADGSEMYFHSARPGGKGEYDLWVTKRVGDDWGPPEAVDAANTPESEGWPFVTQDGGELWFTRMYEGTPAIYRSTRVDGQWSVPELILSRFAGEPTLDNAGNLYFVHHFYRDDRMIEADIYVARRKH